MIEPKPSGERSGELLAALERLGLAPSRGARIVDAGCGHGELVAALRARGFDARGFDFEDGLPKERDASHLLVLPASGAPWPFDDESADLVVSDQVIEHVAPLDAFFGELRRVLRPGAASVHVFPSWFRLVEPHVNVPLAGFIRCRPWLVFWAALGKRLDWQKKVSIQETVRSNTKFLTESTHYRTGRAIARAARAAGLEAAYAEHVWLAVRADVGWRSRLLRALPLGAAISGLLHERLLVVRKR